MSDSDELYVKLKTLNETIWEGRATEKQINNWLGNFKEPQNGERDERLHAFHLLGQFMYYGNRQIRELLKALFRDVYKYPIVASLRKQNGDTTDTGKLASEFGDALSATRFLGIGNPSESGTHLLYYFRQENVLSKNLFIHAHEIFSVDPTGQVEIADRTVKRYVFIDDFCGSGTQAREYSEKVVAHIKRLDPNAHVSYYALIATVDGMQRVRAGTAYNVIDSVIELDSSFKCFSPESRYFDPGDPTIDQGFALDLCLKHGRRLVPYFPLGFADGQLMIGFFHNTPDNSLPIFWADGNGWKPIFKRYSKI